MAHYNDHLKYRGQIYAENPRGLRKQPNQKDYEEYVYLKDQVPDFEMFATKTSKRKADKKLREYESDYDWRDNIISDDNYKTGLTSILGDIVVPCQFTEIREKMGQRIFPVGTRGCQEYSVASLNMKNLMSPTPRNCVLNALILALKDSAEAFVSLRLK